MPEMDNTLLIALLFGLAALLVWLRQRRCGAKPESETGRPKTKRQYDVDVRVIVTPSVEMLDMLAGGRRNSNGASPPMDGTDVDGKQEESNVRPTRFLIDAMVLAQSFRHVCPSQVRVNGGMNGFKERFHYATGLRIDERTYAITQIVPVKYAVQSAGGVRVADASNIAALANLDRLGLPLVAHFHSHPGFGRESNRPSMIDRNFQERLERGGHIAIGVIFSRDGFARAFAGDLDRFVLEVQGKNATKVSDNEFKLELENGAV